MVAVAILYIVNLIVVVVVVVVVVVFIDRNVISYTFSVFYATLQHYDELHSRTQCKVNKICTQSH